MRDVLPEFHNDLADIGPLNRFLIARTLLDRDAEHIALAIGCDGERAINRLDLLLLRRRNVLQAMAIAKQFKRYSNARRPLELAIQSKVPAVPEDPPARKKLPPRLPFGTRLW
jgi:hypothetical protein